MNTITELLGSYWLRVLGETLLHSLWQGFLIMAIVVLILRCVPSKESNFRYGVASFGFFLLFVTSISTFISMYKPMQEVAATKVIQSHLYNSQLTGNSMVGLYAGSVKAYVESILPFFLIVWVAGVAFFSLRIVTALVYIEKIKGESILLQNEWTAHVQQLANQFNIGRSVQLAESALIRAPIVFGYLKPIILIPIGMCSALSTKQLETIFLHEMMHIRRKDYLINFIQTCVEAIYFFNPFIWIISGIIKQEREHCCDDAVVKLSGNTKEYALALATLEEVRLSKTGLSISLATNKNQLLKRIKRLMEKSVKNYSSRDRIMPILLIAIGLLCASWVSTHVVKNELPSGNISTVLSDTTKKIKKNKLKKARASTDIVTPLNESKRTESASAPHISEDKGSDASATDNSDHANSYHPYPNPNIHIPLPPDIDMAIALPPLPNVNAMMHGLEGSGSLWDDKEKWEQFGKAFEEDFKAKFNSFYERHDEEIQEMLANVQQKLSRNFDEDWQRKMEDFAAKQQQWSAEQAIKLQQQAEKLRALENLNLKNFEEGQQKFQKQMEAFEENNKRFHDELKRELTNDGYLRKDEQLENIHWRNSQLEINGKSIKAEHEKKYNDLRQRYFSNDFEEGNDD